MSHAHNELFTEGHRCTPIYPQTGNDSEFTTGWQSMRDYHRAVVILLLGASAAGAAVDLKITQATNDAGAGAKNVTGKVITTLDGGDDNSMVAIELDTSELDVDGKYDHINVQLNCGGTVNAVVAALLIRFQPRFKPVGDENFDEVVA